MNGEDDEEEERLLPAPPGNDGSEDQQDNDDHGDDHAEAPPCDRYQLFCKSNRFKPLLDMVRRVVEDEVTKDLQNGSKCKKYPDPDLFENLVDTLMKVCYCRRPRWRHWMTTRRFHQSPQFIVYFYDHLPP